ncbi:trimeric intracellular cation channel family protein [Pseudobacillus wudalianchiensis]|uniref:Glycine transporter domain-containing protein n=1 Tax=Pseudobacillus wudalianchiensis TaxID=1743143 RepID=A0A1B9B6V0_9BACI|nr:trimeric intracellular cation channel family protein [Bacillus wudalianchiensis]OCA91798.1 hypothetical protein A8F95_19730 [Bacillus wudalianchiensis]
MIWELLNIIGTIAFAVSGAIIAMEEDYDILGVCVLGLTTAFGGGAVRNLLIGIPIETIWTQGHLFEIAFFAILIVFLLPSIVIKYWKFEIIFDAVGLAAFAIQGANYAVSIGAPLIVAIVAATMTGAGGGMIRDVFAGRKPMIFRSEIYALWAALAGLAIGLGWVRGSYSTFILLTAIVFFRILSVHFKWNLPHNNRI